MMHSFRSEQRVGGSGSLWLFKIFTFDSQIESGKGHSNDQSQFLKCTGSNILAGIVQVLPIDHKFYDTRRLSKDQKNIKNRRIAEIVTSWLSEPVTDWVEITRSGFPKKSGYCTQCSGKFSSCVPGKDCSDRTKDAYETAPAWRILNGVTDF
jgi:hypothetical protein